MHLVKFRPRDKGPGPGFGLRVESLSGFCVVVLVYYGALFSKPKFHTVIGYCKLTKPDFVSHPNIGSSNFYFLVLLVFGFCNV